MPIKMSVNTHLKRNSKCFTTLREEKIKYYYMKKSFNMEY